MARNIDKELESAIVNLPIKEKNKLLLRLIGKDEVLVEQLHFKLLEDPVYDLELRLKNAQEAINILSRHCNTSNSKFVLSSMRNAFTVMNKHKKITGDKYSEAFLSSYILNSYLSDHEYFFMHRSPDFRCVALFTYVAKKIGTTINLVRKLHEDYHIEFEKDINFVLNIAHKGNLEWYAKELPQTFEY